MASQTAVVESGSDVVIRVGEEQERWTIVAPYEADPLRRRLSELSPLGFALLGRRRGETVTVRGPAPYRVTVVAIGRPGRRRAERRSRSRTGSPSRR